MSNLELIKAIRHKTGLSLKDIANAVDTLKTDDENTIVTYLREQGMLKQQARQDRETKQGGIFSYVHDDRIGVMIELRCETDFVSRSDTFKELGQDLCLHIAAFQPRFVSEDQVDNEFVQSELDIARQQLANEGKPEDKIEMILNGKKAKIVQEYSLLSQPYLKNPDIDVKSRIGQASQATGENIIVSRFTIFNLNG